MLKLLIANTTTWVCMCDILKRLQYSLRTTSLNFPYSLGGFFHVHLIARSLLRKKFIHVCTDPLYVDTHIHADKLL